MDLNNLHNNFTETEVDLQGLSNIEDYWNVYFSRIVMAFKNEQTRSDFTT